MTALGSNFYFPPSRLNFLVQLRSLLTQNKIVAIEGGIGIGKTVLLEEVLTTAMPDANKCYVTASKTITDVQLRSRIIEQLFGNVLFDPEKPLISSFLEFNEQTELMIALDNAHFLSAKLVGELLQVFSELNGAGIQFSIVLGFDKTISSTLLSIKSQLLAVESVPLLSKDESYHLLNTYFPELPTSSDSKVKRWIDNAKGIPIQLLAYNEQHTLELTNGSGLNIKLWGSIVAVASVVLAIVIYAYNTGYFETASVKGAAELDEGTNAVDQVINANKKLDVSQLEYKKLVSSASKKPNVESIASASEVLAALNQGQVSATVIEPQLNLTSEMDTKVADTDVLEQTLSTKSPTPPITNQEVDNAVAKPSKATTVQSGNVIDLNTPDATSNNVEKSVPLNQSESVVSTATEVFPDVVESSLYRFQNDAFLSLPDNKFVLQLTAVSSEPTLVQYLASAPVDPSTLRIYKIQRNSADWIVVTYGLFDSIDQARETAQQIEPNAWAKSIAVIQQQITAFNNRFGSSE